LNLAQPHPQAFKSFSPVDAYFVASGIGLIKFQDEQSARWALSGMNGKVRPASLDQFCAERASNFPRIFSAVNVIS
jgi:hypothetical protein